jgi:hypothetical protein
VRVVVARLICQVVVLAFGPPAPLPAAVVVAVATVGAPLATNPPPLLALPLLGPPSPPLCSVPPPCVAGFVALAQPGLVFAAERVPVSLPLMPLLASLTVQLLLL